MNSNQCTQSVVSPRIYTYKITFEDVPFYYYGAYKEKIFNEEYYGTPYTHKWCWEMYQPKKQILEVFDYTDEGWIKANNVEKRLIKPVYNSDPYCLNESCGGVISLEIMRKNGRKAGDTYGRKLYEDRRGLFALTKEQLQENGRKGISKRKENNYELYMQQVRDAAKKSNGGSKGGTKTQTQRWKCLVTGYIANPASLARYQKARGIDTIMRERLS